ncbi:hypothetical protein AYY26_19670 [Photobacterium phosphoreum]|uniref:Uncharacterized protein n=1 Tax=Photobacterium carnosum TaxID=2023717 RepID=A0A2N4UQ24_9GAMM|nr:hypothetical protein [Photobacterium phosphoreum]OBU42760.1 hypothetical protein AYY26_19670 [Photobacterium phosphoreum]PLC57120.1 hypothetical protein CIK00_15165 [Photobacterium carnosum]
MRFIISIGSLINLQLSVFFKDLAMRVNFSSTLDLSISIFSIIATSNEYGIIMIDKGSLAVFSWERVTALLNGHVFKLE